MKISHSLIIISFVYIAFSVSVSTLAYEPDPTKEATFYCPGYANCFGIGCLYHKTSLTTESKSFNKTEKVSVNCDSLEVELSFPDIKDESFVGNKTWTCSSYHDAGGHHWALVKITLNKPTGVIGSQVRCKANIDDCKLFDQTPSEMIFIAGLPKSCVTWENELELSLPSKTEFFDCLEYANCTGDFCHFRKTSNKTTTKPFLIKDDTITKCDALKVDMFYPGSKDSAFSALESYTCFQYANENGSSFSVVEISLNKPEDVVGNQLICSVLNPTGNTCTKHRETSTKLLYVAGVPDTCFPWTHPTPEPAQDHTVDCPSYFKNCTDNICHFNGTYIQTSRRHFIAGAGSWFTCGSLKVDILFPDSKDSEYIGNNTHSCFQYDNGKGTTFQVAVVTLTKPDDVKGSQVVCTFDEKKCTLQNETESALTLVAGFPSSCAPWVPSTPTPTETTIEAPTTTLTTQSTVTESDEPPTTATVTTAGTNTTGETTVSPTQANDTTFSPGETTMAEGSTSSSAGSDTTEGTTISTTAAGSDTTEGTTISTTAGAPDSTTQASSGTTSSPETTTQGSSVARLELGTIMVMAAALFIHRRV